MLGLIAAQLKHKVDSKEIKSGKAVWVDVSTSPTDTSSTADRIDRLVAVQGESKMTLAYELGTMDGSTNYIFSYNIEAMSAFVPVERFFDHVYLVDLSPSLCEVARQRFQRLGWKNVTVLCQDARSFRLPEKQIDPRSTDATTDRADMITMSYSLSMIPGKI